MTRVLNLNDSHHPTMSWHTCHSKCDECGDAELNRRNSLRPRQDRARGNRYDASNPAGCPISPKISPIWAVSREISNLAGLPSRYCPGLPAGVTSPPPVIPLADLGHRSGHEAGGEATATQAMRRSPTANPNPQNAILRYTKMEAASLATVCPNCSGSAGEASPTELPRGIVAHLVTAIRQLGRGTIYYMLAATGTPRFVLLQFPYRPKAFP